MLSIPVLFRILEPPSIVRSLHKFDTLIPFHSARPILLLVPALRGITMKHDTGIIVPFTESCKREIPFPY